MGHRNVEGITFDARGTLWASEFGEKEADELNQIEPGANYGWPRVEGARRWRRLPRPARPVVADVDPARRPVSRSRTAGPGSARCAASACTPSGSAARTRASSAGTSAGRFGRIRQVMKAPDGTLWITTSNRDGRGAPGPNDDKVIKISLS